MKTPAKTNEVIEDRAALACGTAEIVLREMGIEEAVIFSFTEEIYDRLCNAFREQIADEAKVQ